MTDTMFAKVTKPTRRRLVGRNYWYAILKTKNVLGLKYSDISRWMEITTNNLTSMISQRLNPYPENWFSFKAGLRNYLKLKSEVGVWVKQDKIKSCECGCGRIFLLGSPQTRKWFNRKCARK